MFLATGNILIMQGFQLLRSHSDTGTQIDLTVVDSGSHA